MSKLTAPQAHTLADQAVTENYGKYVLEVHDSIRSQARQGAYSKTVVVPREYASRIINMIQYFSLFGYATSVSANRLVISW